jgi:uncharacterized protein YigE (DUF2233 family)
VGILPDGKILFAMNQREWKLYEFEQYFQSKGCENALYLDGTISQMYVLGKEESFFGGYFGVIIGIWK